MTGKSQSRIKYLYYTRGFRDYDELVEYINTEHGQHYYVLYEDNELELPVFHGFRGQITAYLGLKDPNSINSIFSRLKSGERNGICQSRITGERFRIHKFTVEELESEGKL